MAALAFNYTILLLKEKSHKEREREKGHTTLSWMHRNHYSLIKYLLSSHYIQSVGQGLRGHKKYTELDFCLQGVYGF